MIGAKKTKSALAMGGKTAEDAAPRRLRHLALVQGFDKVEVWVSRPLAKRSLDELSAHCASPIIHFDCRQRYNPVYRQKLILIAPAISMKAAFGDAFGSDTHVMPICVEVASDIIFDTEEEAQAALSQFLGAARFMNVRTKPVRHLETYYLAPFAGSGDRRGGVRPAIYADKPSKLHSGHEGSAALHFENRISGSATLRRVGISSWSDLVAFDHEAYWDQKLRMYPTPSLTRLGAILSGREGRDVTDKSLRQRARGFRREVIARTERTSGTPMAAYLFQMAFKLRPELARALPYVGLREWLETLRL